MSPSINGGFPMPHDSVGVNAVVDLGDGAQEVPIDL